MESIGRKPNAIHLDDDLDEDMEAECEDPAIDVQLPRSKYRYDAEGHPISPTTNRPIIPAGCLDCGGPLDRSGVCYVCNAELTPSATPPYLSMIPRYRSPRCIKCKTNASEFRTTRLCKSCAIEMKISSLLNINQDQIKQLMKSYKAGRSPESAVLGNRLPLELIGTARLLWSQLTDSDYHEFVYKILKQEEIDRLRQAERERTK